jgi:hypothetical protein
MTGDKINNIKPGERLIACRGLINLYNQPTQRSELESQYYLGDKFEIISAEKNYLKVKTEDELTGWIYRKSVVPYQVIEEAEALAESRRLICQSVYSVLREKESGDTPPVMIVYMGTILELDEPVTNYYLKTRERLRVRLPDGELAYLEKRDFMVLSNYIERYYNILNVVIETANKLLGTPYLWGGTSPGGLDCSGLIRLSFRMAGKHLPRNSSQQARVGEKIDTGEDFDMVSKGDLLFFSEETAISHVGLSLGGGRFIHSALSYGSAVITSIFKKDKEFNPLFKEIFRFARRFEWKTES